MDKFQLKTNKIKRKSIETGLLMGQNTNVFSQLSATYLQNKANVTEDEEQFLQATQIVEYHDQNINRLIALLRKKAEVTKIKAVLELKEEIFKMTPEDIAEFMPTFAHLFSEITLNEQSKQVCEEFVTILQHLLQEHKKIVLGEINTLYGPMLISMRITKTASFLFKGTEEEQLEKAVILLLKPDTRKKFLIMFNIVMACEQLEKMGQTHFQKNCAALMKIIKDLVKIFERTPKRAEMQDSFKQLLEELSESLSGKCIDEYIKNGGKAKAAILELYACLLDTYARHREWKIHWQRFAKLLTSNFLDKDPVVQQTLWKHCNFLVLSTLKLLGKGEEKGSQLLNFYFSKSDEKLLEVLSNGGVSMYKQLPHYTRIFPHTSFEEEETHKMLINKLAFIRKMMAQLLGQEDQNQVRMECYYQLCRLFIHDMRNLKLSHLDDKKSKQIASLAVKTEREFIQNLQDKFYTAPPGSKNAATYYIPQHINALIQEFDPNFLLKFDPASTFSLYRSMKPTENAAKYIQLIFNNCQGNFKLLLQFLQTFPKRKIPLDMTQANPEIEITAKIFLLSTQDDQWFTPNWDIKKQLVIYDPRIKANDLQAQPHEQQFLSLHFRPIDNILPPQYDQSNHDQTRYAYFQRNLLNPESMEIMKFLIPFVSDFLIVRNEAVLNRLLTIFKQKAEELQAGKWTMGQHSVLVIRILSEVIIEFLSKNLQFSETGLVDDFLKSYCEFARMMHNYELEREFEQLVKRVNCLVMHQKYQQKLFESASRSIFQSYRGLLTSATAVSTEKLEKQRKNKLRKCTDFISKTLWYTVSRSSVAAPVALFRDLVLQEKGWAQAAHRYEPWMIGFHILDKAGVRALKEISQQMLQNVEKYMTSLCYLLSSHMILPLRNHPEVKKLFAELQNEIILAIVCQETPAQLQLIECLVQNVLKDDLYLFSQGVQYLLKNILQKANSILQSQIDQFGTICIEKPLAAKNNTLIGTLIIINFCQTLPLKEIVQTGEIYQKSFHTLKNCENGLTFCKNLAVCAVFWKKDIGIQTLDVASPKSILTTFLDKFLISLGLLQQSEDMLSKNFAVYSLFSFLNSVASHRLGLLKEYEVGIMNVFWQPIQQGTPLHCITQSTKMLFAGRFIQSVDPSLQSRLITDLPLIACTEYNFYQDLLGQMENQQQNCQALPYHESIIELFIEIAEFILRISPFLSEKIVPDEEILLRLMQCPFGGLKKSSFILLKQMYELKIAKRNPPTIFEQLLHYKLNSEDELNSTTAGKISTHFYAWQVLLLRRDCTERTSEEGNNLSLEDYITANAYSEVFLLNVFTILEEKLDFMKNQQEFDLTYEELLTADFSVSFEEEADLESKILKMTMRTLFVFIINFPIFLRDFMDRHKKYRTLCDRLLRLFISDAIFKEEVEKIELRQPEWKASGTISIFVTPKSKEIYAEYTHDVIRIGLRLVMKGNYPLAPIGIEFGEGLKMEDGTRWSLMLQTQLHNRNNTIINGILLWKQNIDKKLAGVEECSICFDIVSPNGQLPKKACKTCKKKFHGNCILRWFTKSNKSECPLCKSQFL